MALARPAGERSQECKTSSTLGMLFVHRDQFEEATEHCERAVDTMLSAMEGYKLRAVFEPGLCSKRAEAKIAAQLLKLLNVPT